jgi:hypothetical protein
MTATENKREVEFLTGTREEKAAQLLKKLVDSGVI